MSGTAGRASTVRLARDAIDFLDQVEEEVQRRGSDALTVHHWVVVACRRPFLARTIARERDVRSANAASEAALASGWPGSLLAPQAVLDVAEEAAVARGDTRIRAWHLVLAVLRRIGIATRDGEAGPEAADAAGVADAEADAGADGAGAGAEGHGVGTGGLDALVTGTPRLRSVTEPPTRPTQVAAPAAPVAAPAAPVAAPATRAARSRPPVRPRVATPLLDQCGTDWTISAAKGELPPMVGREAEMRLLIEGLCRPTKPNVLLVGEPGVGKSALVEGLAQRMADGDVPARLAGRPLFALSMAELTRDSRYYGAMEARLATLIAEARAARAILFIDEGHAMTGSGGREGTGDVASILKPVLARGDLSVISATTEDEYRRFIAPNGALERRFTVVHLAEPGRDAVRRMLAAHRDAIAATHGVRVDDEAIERIVLRTAGLAPHRREPDRSRDVLDQVVARAVVAGSNAVSADDVEGVVAAVSGAPEVSDESLAALERGLVRRGLLAPDDAAALVDRLGTSLSGLALRPQRPRASLLLLRTPGGPDGSAVAEAIADGLFGGPEQVIAINVGGITEPSAISGFLGTPQGYVGHGTTLPIHGLAERPHSVLLLRGIDLAHEAFRTLVARGLRDGSLADAQARRIGLSQAVVVLEGRAPVRGERALGFGPAGDAGGRSVPVGGSSAHGGHGLAAAAVGEELADECDLVVVPPAAAGAGLGWVAQTLGRLAASYRSAGVELAWDPEVEAYLARDVVAASARERERAVESRIGRAVRPCLRSGRRPVRARVRGGDAGLVADAEP